MKSKYDRALQLTSKSKARTRKVYDLLLEADSEGDGQATYALATWYLHGTRYTKKDIAKATDLLERAVKKNIPNAAFDLAVSYEKGIGVKKSTKKAFELYTRAALLGERQSIFEVGRMYFHGIGARKDKRLAEVWLSCAEHYRITK